MAMQTENGEAMELIGEIETIETFNGSKFWLYM